MLSMSQSAPPLFLGYPLFARVLIINVSCLFVAAIVIVVSRVCRMFRE